jgi:hypothetical protein
VASFFISHASRDNAEAKRLRDWLIARGYTSIFLDFDPEEGIPPGTRWENELYSRLRRSDVLIFLGTQAAVDSKWCHTELAMSRSLGRTIIPLRLDDAARHPLVADTQWIRLRIDGPESLEPLAGALHDLEIAADGLPPWDPSLSPYPGLGAFDENQAGVFFGRSEESKEIVELLRSPQSRDTERLLLVTGASGCGKSSLVRAAVLPRLRRREPAWVVASPVLPTTTPVAELARALARATNADPASIRARIDGAGLAAVARDLARNRPQWDASVVLVVDQAERLTQLPPTDRIAFLDLVAAGLHGETPLRVVFTLRSEYGGELVNGSALEGKPLPGFPVGRLDTARLADVIEKPAERAGLDFEPQLVQRIVVEASSGPAAGDPLPLLAFTLQKLYELDRPDRLRITHADYERIGGVVGALKSEADRTVAALRRRGLENAIVPTLLELAHVDPDRAPAGRTVRRGQFDDEGRAVLDAFVEARLLTVSDDAATINVAHDALLQEWAFLNHAIDLAKDDLLARARLERDAGEWDALGRDPSYLATGRRLAQARKSLTAEQRAANPVVGSFVDASVRNARAQTLRSRGFALAVAAAAVLAVGGYLLVQHVRESNAKAAAREPLVGLAGGGAVDAHEVTNGQYDRCVDWGHCPRRTPTGAHPHFVSAAPNRPVYNVNEAQAASFCGWIGRRLPTRGELARADRTTRVAHLQRDPGGREWTSTKEGTRYITVLLNPDRSVTVQSWDGGFPDFQSVFRCAQG